MAFTPVQLSYTQNPQEAVLGQVAEGFGPQRVKSRFVRGFGKAGYGVFLSSGKGTNAASLVDPGEVYHVPTPVAAANTSAIHTGASSASIQTITTFNGTYGAVDISPPRPFTFTFDSSTDWDPTSATFTYVNEKGATVSETIAVATSTAPATTGKVRRPVSLTIPAQTGAAGVLTIGVSALTAGTEALFEGVLVRQPFKMTIATAGLFGYPGLTGVTGTADYVDGDPAPVLSEGGIWVYSETAVADGDPVYVRTAVNGGLNVLGAFANAAGTGLTLLTRARFVRDSLAAGPAWARFLYM